LKTRIAKPPDYYADKATRPGTKYAKYRFRNHGISRFSTALGLRNELNTAFLAMKFREDSNERLLVTYDAGRPYEIDTETLEVVTPVGANKEWRAETSLNLPFSPILSTAHPSFDAHKNEMFTVNYGRSLGNFLETMPFLNEIDEIPQEIDKIIGGVAGFIEEQNFATDFFKNLSQFSQKTFQFYMTLIDRITNI
jgi:hypothetical protein